MSHSVKKLGVAPGLTSSVCGKAKERSIVIQTEITCGTTSQGADTNSGEARAQIPHDQRRYYSKSARVNKERSNLANGEELLDNACHVAALGKKAQIGLKEPGTDH
jgi:hypothetical protein